MKGGFAVRRAVLWLLLFAMLWGLTGCTALDAFSLSDAKPDLRLLERPGYEENPPVEAAAPEQGALQLDLWLDASQVMGGINQNTLSMYPHHSRKYREGGFHYRAEGEVGLYENVLRCMLSAVEGSRVRLLRYGNERLPDAYLTEQGLAAADASPQQLRSIRRDMLTYAIDPMPTVFSTFSAEKMTDSFYSLGTPKLNQLNTLHPSLLENPALAQSMSSALDAQIRAIGKNSDDSLTALENDSNYPLLYALDNLDLTRLSVITCDPAAIRRLNAVDSSGVSHAIIQEILEDRGVFDAGLNVGMYAFTLDYMGQLSSFTAADLSEPLLWGRLDYNNYTGKTAGTMVMPRTLLTFVIGAPEQVEHFTTALNAQLATSEVLKSVRGERSSQLTYTHNGETVTPEPFTFACEYMQIGRAQVKQITQYTDNVSVAAHGSNVSVSGTLHTVTFAPADGVQPDRAITLSLPLSRLSESMVVDAAQLSGLSVQVENSLILSDILPNAPETVVPEGVQTITLRDRIYVFSHSATESPVTCSGLSSDGETLTVSLKAAGSELKEGYYRLVFTADLPGESLSWETPAWIAELNANVTNEQIASWETFTDLLARHERKRSFISRQYQSAWGDSSNHTYYGEPVPDFPPVNRAPGLSELVRQLQGAAHPATMPYIRFVFDVFVTNEP